MAVPARVHGARRAQAYRHKTGDRAYMLPQQARAVRTPRPWQLVCLSVAHLDLRTDYGGRSYELWCLPSSATTKHVVSSHALARPSLEFNVGPSSKIWSSAVVCRIGVGCSGDLRVRARPGHADAACAVALTPRAHACNTLRSRALPREAPAGCEPATCSALLCKGAFSSQNFLGLTTVWLL